MRIAILGATSEIGKNLVASFAVHGDADLVLYARRPEAVAAWLATVGLSGRYLVSGFDAFDAKQQFDAIINFVGVGNPAQAVAMGASIFDVTLAFDELALQYVRRHPECKYLFLSSGAVYGGDFSTPVDENSRSVIEINQLRPQDWYGAAKLHAECRHRSLPQLPIVDLRVFSYFSHTQDVSARFLMTDAIRAIRSGDTLVTSDANIVRDYLGARDFHQLVSLVLAAKPVNEVVDCHSLEPVDKLTLLASLAGQFGLKHEVRAAAVGVNATGAKMNYFSKNRRSEVFGYSPSMTSLSTILEETRLMICA